VVGDRYLNRDLANTGVDYEVLNFGVSGYGVAQAVETLRSRALQLDPDIVVYAYCLNDAQAYSLEMANLIALTRCKIIAVENNRIEIEEIDAFDNSPVIDIKCFIPGPVLTSKIKLPDWV